MGRPSTVGDGGSGRFDARDRPAQARLKDGKTMAKPQARRRSHRRCWRARRHDGAMRREVARTAVTAAAIAMAVLVLPLAAAVYLLVVGNERSELERAALQAATRVDGSFAAGDPAELPAPEAGGQLGLYDLTGRRQAGTGPATADDVTRQAAAGLVVQGRRDGMLVAAVPVSAGERVTAVVRVSSPAAVVYRRTALAWVALACAMAVALGAAVYVARRRARQLTAPLEHLAATSRAVGDGDLTARAAPSGIEEIDHVAATQNDTVARLAELLERERHFAANASHQLRTPLAGLQIVLENARAAAGLDLHPVLDEALATSRRLQLTVEDVLSLHRGRSKPVNDVRPSAAGAQPDPTIALERVLDETVARWRGPLAAEGRQLSLRCDQDLSRRRVDSGPVSNILDVLLDNALRHGAGRVQIAARSAGRATAIDVADEGPGVPPNVGDPFERGTGSGHGIGLSLAREFAVSVGGRLVLSVRHPPVFTLLIPAGADQPDPT